MSVRYLGAIGLSGVVAALGVLALAPVSAQQGPARAASAAPAKSAYKAPRLANGQPDLTGVWANNSVTPMQRPKELGERQYLTDDEVRHLKSRAEELFAGDGDAAFGDEIFAAALSDRTKIRRRFVRQGHGQLQLVLAGRPRVRQPDVAYHRPARRPQAASHARGREAGRRLRQRRASSAGSSPIRTRIGRSASAASRSACPTPSPVTTATSRSPSRTNGSPSATSGFTTRAWCRWRDVRTCRRTCGS